MRRPQNIGELFAAMHGYYLGPVKPWHIMPSGYTAGEEYIISVYAMETECPRFRNLPASLDG